MLTYRDRVRWNSLFADLEAQLDAAEDEVAVEHAERVRAEVAGVHLRDRLRGAAGLPLGVRLLGGARVDGRLRAAGPDWLLLEEPTGEVLVPLSVVTVLEGLPRALAAPAGPVESRLGLASVLRAVARDRSPVRVALLGEDVGVITGTLDRVAADHLEVARHARDEPRRPGAVRGVVVVPLAALACVRRTG